MQLFSLLKPWRKGVVAVIQNKQGLIWVGQRMDYIGADGWQLPQGGREPGETVEETLRREIREETGLVNIATVKISDFYTSYRYGSPNKHPWKGQRQHWGIFLFNGDDSEVKLNGHDQQEFGAWKWAQPRDVLENVWSVRRGSYERAFMKLGLVTV